MICLSHLENEASLSLSYICGVLLVSLTGHSLLIYPSLFLLFIIIIVVVGGSYFCVVGDVVVMVIACVVLGIWWWWWLFCVVDPGTFGTSA